jgi:diadenosine tetraphosphate (Ap4A) HIT family hydrolase
MSPQENLENDSCGQNYMIAEILQISDLYILLSSTWHITVFLHSAIGELHVASQHELHLHVHAVPNWRLKQKVDSASSRTESYKSIEHNM